MANKFIIDLITNDGDLYAHYEPTELKPNTLTPAEELELAALAVQATELADKSAG